MQFEQQDYQEQCVFELHKEYTLNKFIIFVPRRTIKIGIKQNIELTKSYFQIEYAKQLKVFEYSSYKSDNKVIDFISNSNKDPSALILTNSTIDKK